jgi:serine/threonine protein phosphatase 1
MQVYRETIDMIRARPILGQGAGTFADAYPMFQGPGEHNLVWLRAHSTYLQAAAELGLPVFAVLLATIGFIFVVVVRGLLKRVAPMPVALAALGAGAGLAVQSTIDFSVQIQAVALTAVALLGAGFGEAASRKRIAAGSGREPSEANPAEPAGDEPARFERVDVKIPGRTGTTAMPEPAKANAARFERVSVTIPMRQAVSSAELAPGTIPDGMRLYVFGDVHGRFDLVQRLRDAILRDRAEAAPAKVKVIGLGDFIDRGPDSRGVIEAFTTGFFDCEAAFIRGNHEQMLLDFLDDADAAPVWLHNGAVETLRSYGVDLSDTPPRTPAEFERLRTEFRDRLPPSHAAFLGDLPLSLVVGGYFFVHAGARPGVPLLQQKSSDLLWIRQGFVDRDHEFEKIVVHGHTPVDRPYLGKYRINLDTGAYMTNRLSCLVLETRERRILEI